MSEKPEKKEGLDAILEEEALGKAVDRELLRRLWSWVVAAPCGGARACTPQKMLYLTSDGCKIWIESTSRLSISTAAAACCVSRR